MKGLIACLFVLFGVALKAHANAQLTNSSPAKGAFVISWGGRGTLETAGNISGPWTAVTNAIAPYTNTVRSQTQFFRLNQTVDATTLHKKVLCGYQGWFRCAGDSGGGVNWDHWSRNWSAPPTASTLTFEMWPDLTDYSNTYPVPGFTYPGGAPAYLYSADDQSTINLHFDWMLDYGIDGVVVQRFVTQTAGQPGGSIQPWKTNVLLRARAAANVTGRVFALEYDMSGAANSTLFYQLTNDWTWLATSLNIPQDPRYLHHNGKPVLYIFGFYPDRFTNSDGSYNTNLPQQIIAWFKTNSIQPVTLIGSGEWQWRTETAPGWSNIFRSFNGYMPWNTGNYTIVVQGGVTNDYATTNFWAADIQAATNAGMLYLPELYPGFSWDNLQQLPPGTDEIDRLNGNFLWQQFYAVASYGLDSAFVGMFDEVDEGTAIYKVSNTPPTQGFFVTYDGLPTDWYLRLTAAGSEVLCGQLPNTPTIPISP